MMVASNVGHEAASGDVGSPSILTKGFDVLGCFGPTRHILSLSEISRRSALPKSTVHRVLGMLIELGAVERRGDRYGVGVRMFAVGSAAFEARLRVLALPHLERLHRRTGQNLHLAVLRGHDVLYVERLRSATAFRCPTLPGATLPAHGTAVGKAMLAFTPADPGAPTLERITTRTVAEPAALAEQLAAVRRTGVALDREEAVVGLACVAAPVLVAGEPVAAVSVAFPAALGGGQPLEAPLRETAAAIARSIGAEPDLDPLPRAPHYVVS